MKLNHKESVIIYLSSKKHALVHIWKQRKKQILKVPDNTIGMYGSASGFTGSSIDRIPSLELAKENNCKEK